jgi:dTDP-4-dehydrorhamnose reductase
MRAWIVGITGQLATELRRVEFPRGLELLPAQRVELGEPEQLVHYLESARPELVINAAAYTAVDRAESERERAFAINEHAPRALAEWCARFGAALVHVSTDYVFDGSKRGAYVEDDPTGPLNVYGASKLAGEQAIRQTLERHLILRTSWVYSAHGNNFVKTMLRLAAQRPELRVVSDQIGKPTSAHQLANAIARALAGYAATRSESRWGTYHVAGGSAASWFDLAQGTLELAGITTARAVPIPASEYPTPAARPSNSVLDTSRFERVFAASLAPWREELPHVLQELLTKAPD